MNKSKHIRSTNPRSLSLPIVLGVVLCPLTVLAQWPVQTQVNRGGEGGPASAAARFDNNLGFGNLIGESNSLLLLPSQVRIASWTAGALPSQSNMLARAVGPLPASGTIAYVPTPTQYSSGIVTPGNFVNRQLSQPPSTNWTAFQMPSLAAPANYIAPSLSNSQVTPFSTIGGAVTIQAPPAPTAPAAPPVVNPPSVKPPDVAPPASAAPPSPPEAPSVKP